MPRTRSLAWAELKIGLVSIFAIVMATTLIFLLSGSGGFFWQRYSLKTMFSNIAGLKEGAPVRVAGVEVGSVSEVNFIGDQVEVVMEVNKDHQARITSTSVASLGSVSLLGEAAVDITAASGGSPIPEWGYVRSGRALGTVGDVSAQAGVAIEEAAALVADLRAGRGSLGLLMTDERLYNELTALVSAAEDVARHQQRPRDVRPPDEQPRSGQIARGVNGESPGGDRPHPIGGGKHRQAAERRRAAASLTSMSSNLDSITGRINRGEGTAGKLVSDNELYNRLNSLSDRIDKVMAGLQQGDGTAGQLLRDRQLYENMNGTMVELKSLVSDIRKDPRKYLNVRVSLF